MKLEGDLREEIEKGQSLFLSPEVRRSLVLKDLIERLLPQDMPHEKYDLRMLNMQRFIGPLEAELMEVVWQKGEASVREVYQILSHRREIAYTTVLTVLRNLNHKGILHRRRENGSYIYFPCTSREEFIRSRVSKILDLLLDQFPGPTLDHLIECLDRGKDRHP